MAIYLVVAKTQPMKRLAKIYYSNPLLHFFVQSLAVFVWAITLVFIIVIMAVAFTP